MSYALENAVIAITGAGSGIGQALAHLAAQHKMRLALSDINEEQLQDTVTHIKQLHPEAHIHVQVVDVADKAAVKNWAKDVARQWGQINVIINNAGVGLSSSVKAMKHEDFEWLMNINFWGVIHGCTEFLPYLEDAQWGHIINISSLFGLISTPNTSAYNASKFAVRGFTESLSIEMALSSPHISVSCVHPGGIKTNIANFSREGDGHVGKAARMSREESKKEFNERLAKTTPQQAAHIIFNGLMKKKSRILVGNDAKALDVIQRFLPVRYKNVVKKILG